MMPNPAKPVEVKRRNGNPGRNRTLPKLEHVLALPKVRDAPDPIRPLGVEGSRSWERVWTQGAAWITPASDIETVQILCELIDERVALRNHVIAGDGSQSDRISLDKLTERVMRVLCQLGMTPIERGKAGFGEVMDVNPLAELLSRKA